MKNALKTFRDLRNTSSSEPLNKMLKTVEKKMSFFRVKEKVVEIIEKSDALEVGTDIFIPSSRVKLHLLH